MKEMLGGWVNVLARSLSVKFGVFRRGYKWTLQGIFMEL